MFANKGVVCTYTINYVPCYNRKYHNRIEVHYCGECRKLFSSLFHFFGFYFVINATSFGATTFSMVTFSIITIGITMKEEYTTTDAEFCVI